MNTQEKNTARLKIREASLEDVPAVSRLVERVYPGMPPYPDAMLRGQINAFPEGVWVAELGDDIVGYCATIRLKEDRALGEHTWRTVTGGGYGSTHDATGEYLYGYCLLYTSDAADERSSVDLGGGRIIKKKNIKTMNDMQTTE